MLGAQAQLRLVAQRDHHVQSMALHDAAVLGDIFAEHSSASERAHRVLALFYSWTLSEQDAQAPTQQPPSSAKRSTPSSARSRKADEQQQNKVTILCVCVCDVSVCVDYWIFSYFLKNIKMDLICYIRSMMFVDDLLALLQGERRRQIPVCKAKTCHVTVRPVLQARLRTRRQGKRKSADRHQNLLNLHRRSKQINRNHLVQVPTKSARLEIYSLALNPRRHPICLVPVLFEDN